MPNEDTQSGAKQVEPAHAGDWQSIGALHGSARGERNLTKRISAMSTLTELRGDRLLDVGCGTGEYTRMMAPYFAQVEAIDVEQHRLQIFENDPPSNVAISCQSVQNVSFADDTFDVITLIEVLEHLGNVAAAFDELARILKPSGTILLTTPNRLWPFEQHGVQLGTRRLPGYALPGLTWIKPLHHKLSNSDAFTPRNLTELAEPAGLELAGHTYMMPPLDALRSGHPLHRFTDRAERTPARKFAQTLVASIRPAGSSGA